MNITNILKSIGSFLTKLLPWAKTAISHGRDVANEIKEIIDNPAWDVAVSFTSTNLDDAALIALRIWLAKLTADLGLVLNTSEGVTSALTQASKSISEMNFPEAKAGTLNTISAAVATKVAELKGKILPIETALSTAQTAYFHKELLA